jgi:hypothetical protein
MIQAELVSIYGVRGPLMLELFLLKPDIVLPKIVRRLQDRYVDLVVQKLKGQTRTALEVSRLLPEQLTKYQPIPGPREEISEFSFVGLFPTTYHVEDTRLLAEYFESLVEVGRTLQNPLLGQFRACADAAKDFVLDLRSNGSFSVTYPRAVALIICATLVGKLDICNVLDDISRASIAIPMEIGLTSAGLHGHKRLLRIASEAVVTRQWAEAVKEMSGVFQSLALSQAAVLLRTFDLAWKCVASFVAAPPDVDATVTIRVSDGVLSVVDQNDSGVPFSVDLVPYSRW